VSNSVLIELKNWLFAWMVLGVVGFIVAFFLVEIGVSLKLTTWWNWLLVIVIMPIVETLVFNYWFQQSFFEWLTKKINSQWLSYWITGVVVTALFALAHVGAIESLAWLWILPGLVLVLLWFYFSSVTLLSLVHATWNLSLWFVS
jgi:membrane protease YdiL (CAAX protease family)